jgi:hypothetical protein
MRATCSVDLILLSLSTRPYYRHSTNYEPHHVVFLITPLLPGIYQTRTISLASPNGISLTYVPS